MRSEIFRSRYLPWVQPFPGVRALLSRFRERGLKLALASSAGNEELAPLLHIAGVEDLVDMPEPKDAGDESKPDPDVIHQALDALSLPPARVIMIGDTPYDVEAAGRAGIRIIALRCGGWTDEQLAGAAEIYDDPADLLAVLEKSSTLSAPLLPATPS